MITSMAAFMEAWRFESEATARMIGALTDASLAQEVAPGERTLGRIAWHLAGTIPEMMNRTGLGLPDLPEAPPATVAAISEGYEGAARALAAALAEKWTDATLAEEDDMYGERWARGVTLGCLLMHQAHHRGQMTVGMRRAGLTPVGVYGPTREAWATMGMPPPQV